MEHLLYSQIKNIIYGTSKFEGKSHQIPLPVNLVPMEPNAGPLLLFFHTDGIEPRTWNTECTYYSAELCVLLRGLDFLVYIVQVITSLIPHTFWPQEMLYNHDRRSCVHPMIVWPRKRKKALLAFLRYNLIKAPNMKELIDCAKLHSA